MKIKQFEFNLFGVNTYVVWDPESSEAAIVDPGMSNPAEDEELTQFILRNSLIVTTLLNTHLHIDHTLGDQYVEGRYGIGLSAAAEDNFLGKNRQAQAQMFHLSQADTSPLHIDVTLKAGDKVYLGNDYLTALSVPGHSPGSLAFYSRSAGFVITGDALFNSSIGRTDLPGGDHRQLVSAVRSELLSLPDETIVYPGHGPFTTIGAEKHQNPYL